MAIFTRFLLPHKILLWLRGVRVVWDVSSQVRSREERGVGEALVSRPKIKTNPILVFLIVYDLID